MQTAISDRLGEPLRTADLTLSESEISNGRPPDVSSKLKPVSADHSDAKHIEQPEVCFRCISRLMACDTINSLHDMQPHYGMALIESVGTQASGL